MLAYLNLIVWAVLITICAVMGVIGYLWGAKIFLAFAMGWAGSTIVWQMGHKARYGDWFRKPVYRMDSNEGRR